MGMPVLAPDRSASHLSGSCIRHVRQCCGSLKPSKYETGGHCGVWRHISVQRKYILSHLPGFSQLAIRCRSSGQRQANKPTAPTADRSRSLLQRCQHRVGLVYGGRCPVLFYCHFLTHEVSEERIHQNAMLRKRVDIVVVHYLLTGASSGCQRRR